MGLQLSQTEIDALLLVAQSSLSGLGKSAPKKAQKYDFRQPKATDSEQISIVREVLQFFARDFASSAGDYLRAGTEVTIGGMEQTIYREFVRSVPEAAYLSSFRMLPTDAILLFEAEHSVVYPMLDLVLGGPGTGIGEARPLTQIEEQIFETVLNLVAASLKRSCSQLPGIEVESDGSRKRSELSALLPPTDTILGVSFKVRLGETEGNFRLAFPPEAFDPLVRTTAAKLIPEKRVPSPQLRGRIRQSLLEARFAGELVLPPSLVKVRELLTLEPGRVLVLPKRAQDPASLHVVGRPTFVAYPVRLGKQRGARIEKRVSLVTDRKETK
jgi:flagellar motor switch protein FliM